MTATPAPGYKVAVSVDCDACDDAAATVEKLILLKRHLLGARPRGDGSRRGRGRETG